RRCAAPGPAAAWVTVESSSKRGSRLWGAVQGQAPLPAHAARGASQPCDPPPRAVCGHLEDAAGEIGAVTMLVQVSLEALDQIGDGYCASSEIHGHRALRRASVRGTDVR